MIPKGKHLWDKLTISSFAQITTVSRLTISQWLLLELLQGCAVTELVTEEVTRYLQMCTTGEWEELLCSGYVLFPGVHTVESDSSVSRLSQFLWVKANSMSSENDDSCTGNMQCSEFSHHLCSWQLGDTSVCRLGTGIDVLSTKQQPVPGWHMWYSTITSKDKLCLNTNNF